MPFYELKRRARGLIREYSPKIFIVVAIYVVITTVLSELQYRLPNFSEAYDLILERLGSGELPGLNLLLSSVRPFGSVLALLIIIITPIVSFGFKGYCLKISRDINGDYRDLFDGFAYFFKVFVLTLLIDIFVLLWSLLFLFPGFVAAYRYSQAYYILLDDPEKSPLQCIRESKQLMRGKKADLFFLDLSFLGWMLLDAVISVALSFPFPIVALWLDPYTGIVHAGFYNNLIGRVPPLPVRDSEL